VEIYSKNTNSLYTNSASDDGNREADRLPHKGRAAKKADEGGECDSESDSSTRKFKRCKHDGVECVEGWWSLKVRAAVVESEGGGWR
jgi:hypothetical protein